jgi:hypothetical protein
MIACPETSVGVVLWEMCCERLLSAGARRVDLPSNVASARSRDGRFKIQAETFRLDFESEATEARLALVSGQAVNIFAMLALPTKIQTARWSPLLAIETLVISNRVRLVFADLQDVGLSPIRRVMVRERAMPLAARPGLSSQASPPVWATVHSLGGYFFIEKPSAEQYYHAFAVPSSYLDAWCELMAEPADLSDETSPVEDRLRQFKQTHSACWPGRAYLERLFGPDWARLFIHEFFYR